MAAIIKILTPELGGLRATHPAAPDFDRQLADLYGENAGLVADLKPYIVMLSNESAHKVIAYTVLTKVFRSDMKASEQPCRYMFPEAAGIDVAMPRGREIFPGEQRVVTLDCWEINPNAQDLDYFLRQHADVHKSVFPGSVSSAEVSLDAVLYEVGELVGPDTQKMGAMFLRHLRDKRELYKQLLDDPAPTDLLRSLFEDAHYNVYLKHTDVERSRHLPPLEELLKRRSEFSDLRRNSITDTHCLLLDFGEQRLMEGMRGALRNEELVLHGESIRDD